MRLRECLLSGSICGVMVLCSMPAWAAGGRGADSIFASLRPEARQAEHHASRLQSFAWNPELSWETSADHLAALRHEVNDMAKKVDRLEIIRATLPARQQKEVDGIAAQVQLVADDTENAIEFGNAHRDALWLTVYRKDTNNLYREARTLARSVRDAAAAG